MRERMKNRFPPGYEYEREMILFCVVLGCGIFISLDFLFRLADQVEELYYYNQDAAEVLRPYAAAASFRRLAAGSLWGFGMEVLYLGAAALDHWLYYRRASRSIYLMKRLPRRGVLTKSCLLGPLTGMIILAGTMLVVYLFYYLCYRLRIPEECMPRFW